MILLATTGFGIPQLIPAFCANSTCDCKAVSVDQLKEPVLKEIAVLHNSAREQAEGLASHVAIAAEVTVLVITPQDTPCCLARVTCSEAEMSVLQAF